ncbi:Salicylate hydroxylase [Cytospora mali]|uniref:Salicylate hydroxylase n=1 Tax=Cytospora mali TaxID=578113 RepID=A0A194V1R7_CYTMA|nr:Salicylate hydroxylase [Valsa mali var. pyri (nom. inval.)]
MSSEQPILIAIIGGGLGGSALARALMRNPRLDVHVYESNATFSERGASIGLANNAQRALAQVDPDDPELLKRADAVVHSSMRVVMGTGPQAGTVVSDLHTAPQEAERLPRVSLHRGSLLRELIAGLPKERLHTSKRLVSLKVLPDSRVVEITFGDGESAICDAVIGADGIWGMVRQHVLGDAAEEHAPANAGWWDCRNLVPYEKAREVLGDKLFQVDRAYGWAGDGAFIMHVVLENRKLVMCIASVLEHSPPQDAKKRPLTRDMLTDAFGTWMDGPIAKGIIELIMDQPTPQLQRYALYEHKTTPTYANGPVCIMGDAAHAATPWQASGGGQAFEDAMILGALLGCIPSADQVPTAFKIYDEVRRPRAQKILDSSRASGMILCGADQTVGLDIDKMRTELSARAALAEEVDLAVYKEDAVERLIQVLEM